MRRLKLYDETGFGRDAWAKFQRGEAKALNVLVRLYNDVRNVWDREAVADLRIAIGRAAKELEFMAPEEV